jgi:hypothetical protein
LLTLARRACGANADDGGDDESRRLCQIDEAYDLFAHQRDGVLKVAITP